jgi:hypothetical protein
MVRHVRTDGGIDLKEENARLIGRSIENGGKITVVCENRWEGYIFWG